jgi:hypothetical protein
LSVLALALIGLGAWLVCRDRTDTRQVWFEDVRGPLWLPAADEEALVRFAAAAISGQQAPCADLPPALTQDDAPRVVFVSVSDGRTPARIAPGSGRGILPAVEQAISNAQPLPEAGTQPQWIKVDIVQYVTAPHDVEWGQPLELERSLYGIAFEAQSGIAFLPEELVAHTLADSEQVIRPGNIAGYLEERADLAEAYRRLVSSGPVRTYRFTTTGSFWDGDDVVRLYRGHRTFDRISREELRSAAEGGGQYLTRAVRPDGRFAYTYWPKTDSVPDEYNILRHAGTVYAMLELYELTGDDALLGAARRAIGYLLQSVELCPTSAGPLPCIVEDGYTKLGGNALAAIALARTIEVTGDDQTMPLLLDLGRWIQRAQSEGGRFAIQKQSYPAGQVADFVSGYYPGEALLALTRIYALDPDETWLDAAEAGALYLINVRDGGLPDSSLPHDHWLLIALNELYRQRPNPLYVDHALRTADAMLQSQNRHPAYADWLGSFNEPPRSASTATRVEGLCAAYRLARDFGHPQEAEAILEGMWLGAGFQLQTQFRPESAMYLPDPERALGGFHRSLTDFEIRVDYVQHNISSLVCLYRVSGG